jgi:hypothetical protein
MLHLIVSIILGVAIYEVFIAPALNARWERQRREFPKLMEEMRTAAEMARRTTERQTAERRPQHDRIEGAGVARLFYCRIVTRTVMRSTPMDRVLASYQQEFPDPAP